MCFPFTKCLLTVCSLHQAECKSCCVSLNFFAWHFVMLWALYAAVSVSHTVCTETPSVNCRWWHTSCISTAQWYLRYTSYIFCAVIFIISPDTRVDSQKWGRLRSPTTVTFWFLHIGIWPGFHTLEPLRKKFSRAEIQKQLCSKLSQTFVSRWCRYRNF